MFNININSAAKYLGVGFIKTSLKTDGEPFGESKVSKKAVTYKDKIFNIIEEDNPDTRNESNQATNMEIETKSLVKEVPGVVITKAKLQEAVIWSEIIGEPLCKRRKRR